MPVFLLYNDFLSRSFRGKEKMRELRVGIVGFGMIGKVHAFGYRTLPFYARGLKIRPRIAMVATSRPETAAAAGELLGCEGTTDWRRITESPEIDAVHICTPNRDHLAPLLSAIGHQKHIYCDKPVASSLDEALQVEKALDRADGAGIPLYTKVNMMTFHLRFIPALIRAKRLIGEGRLGRVLEYRAAYRHSSNASSDAPYKWKFDVGGGAILDLGSHLADLIDWLVGLPDEICADSVIAHPTRVDPATGRPRPVRAEDAFTVLTRTADPKTGAVTRGQIGGTKLATGSEDEMSLEIYGEKGALRFSLMDAHFLDFYDAEKKEGWIRIAAGARYTDPHTEFPSPKSPAGWIRAHAACIAQFAASIETGAPVGADLRQGIRIQKFLDAVRRSAEARAWLAAR